MVQVIIEILQTTILFLFFLFYLEQFHNKMKQKSIKKTFVTTFFNKKIKKENKKA